MMMMMMMLMQVVVMAMAMGTVMVTVTVDATATSATIPFQVMTAADATPNEVYAANLLKEHFAQMCPKLDFAADGATLFVGNGAATAKACGVHLPTNVMQDPLESYVLSLCSDGNGYAVAGAADSDRGTMYGAYSLLESVGVRFLSSNFTSLPRCPWPSSSSAAFPTQLFPTNHSFVPPLEERDIYYKLVMEDSVFSNSLKDNRGAFDAAHGGSVRYASPPGFVHTSYALVPKDPYYNTHREWFWPQNDSSVYGQLCWTNKSLVAFVISRVQDFLRNETNKDATVISVSQNDNYNYCKTPTEMAVINEEGSPQGPLLRAVNQVADAIKDEFPHIAVDTLAYQYTRPAPKITKPKPNVIIRLCSIECNFAKPFDDVSNAAFQKDIKDWGKISQRTWIWNYVTDFANYIMPFPDWYVIKPNVEFFIQNGVRGIFQEGVYGTTGGDMAELKSYLMGKIMWDPALDDRTVITDFLQHFYGAGAPYMQKYLDLWHQSTEDTEFYMGESVPVTSKYITPAAALTSAQLFNEAAQKVPQGSDYLTHILRSKMPTLYVFLLRWDDIQTYATANKIAWPVSTNKTVVFSQFSSIFNQTGATELSEGGGHNLAWLWSACCK